MTPESTDHRQGTLPSPSVGMSLGKHGDAMGAMPPASLGSSRESLDSRAVRAVMESAYTSGRELVPSLPAGKTQGREVGLVRWGRGTSAHSNNESVDLVLNEFDGAELDDAMPDQVAAG